MWSYCKKNKTKQQQHPDSISPVKGSTEVWMISIIQEAFSYCYMSIFDLALRQHFIVVFVYFRVKYCDYSKSSGPGTEIIALVDIRQRKAQFKFKVRTVNNCDTPVKHEYKHPLHNLRCSSLPGRSTCGHLHCIFSYWVKKILSY